jgi:uncharacterized linocin/CFP29 family protein
MNMTNKYLARADAPFGSDVWELLDAVMIKVAKRELVGRRLLHIEGPYGLDLKSVPLRDIEAASGLTISSSLPVPLLHKTFTLGTRDLAEFEAGQVSLDTRPVAKAALAVSQLEDGLIFNGVAGMPGLLNEKGTSESKLSAWDEVGMAANDIMAALSKLDQAGFHGPYALALTPERYNQLFRLYPGGNQSELAHLKEMVTDGIHKAPILRSEGVLLATGTQYASIMIGQDMTIGFLGPEETEIAFSVLESLTLRVLVPPAICVLRG